MIKMYEGSGMYSIYFTSGKSVELHEDDLKELHEDDENKKIVEDKLNNLLFRIEEQAFEIRSLENYIEDLDIDKSIIDNIKESLENIDAISCEL